MKTTFILLASIGFAATGFTQPEEGSVGQYQLISAVVESTGKGVSVQEHVVFRIDTKTGMTWMYLIGEGKDGKMREFWSRIREIGEEIKPPPTPKSP